MNKSKDEVQEEALAAIGPLKRAGVGMSMGTGKTLVGLKHADSEYTDYLKVLVVAPKLSIHQSWKDDAETFNLSYLLPHITFSTYLSLDKQALDYDIVYLDECHNLLEHHGTWLRAHKGKIVGLTGTPPKYETSMRGKLVEEFCPIVYRYITDEAVEDGILNDYKIFIHPVQLSMANTMLMKTKSGKQWMTSERKSYDYWTKRLDQASSAKERQIMSIMRMKAIMDFPTKLVKARELFSSIQDKTILFANTQNQADKLCTHSYHSENPFSEDNLEMFKLGTIKKLSCVLQLNEGVNIPGLRSGIIMHAYGNERKAAQRLGRLLRLNPEDTSEIHILCYEKTVDEKWVRAALSEFDQTKITWL